MFAFFSDFFKLFVVTNFSENIGIIFYFASLTEFKNDVLSFFFISFVWKLPFFKSFYGWMDGFRKFEGTNREAICSEHVGLRRPIVFLFIKF